MTEAVRRIHKFNFQDNMKSGAKAHVALVDQAANLTEVLVMKSQNEVSVDMSMKTFLKKFFHVYEEDAAILAGILGYSSEVYDEYKNDDGTYMSDQEYVDQKIKQVALLKSTNLDELTVLPSSIHSVVSDLEKSYGEAIAEKTSVSSEGNLGEGLSSNNNITEVEKSMDLTKEQIEDLLKAKDEQAAQIAELIKAKEDSDKVIADLEKAKAEKAEADMVDLVKGYSFVTEEESADLVKALLGSDSVIVATLEKAKNVITEFAAKEVGEEGEDITKGASKNDAVTDAVADLLKARKA